MKKNIIAVSIFAVLALTSCGKSDSSSSSEAASSTAEITSAEDVTDGSEADAEEAPEQESTEHKTAPQQEVGYEGMTEVKASALNDGEYHIDVDSSSSMFKIADCVLKVSGDEMTADIIINSKSYDNLFMGTGDDASKADASELIPYTENEEGQSVFTVPVEALDCEVQCASLSAKKQEWYDRTLVFRADSLPDEAFAESRYTTASDLGLSDGEYKVEVTLEGGSGKAYVESPAKLTVKDGKAEAELIWSSNKYDYMVVGDEKYLPVSTDEKSVFVIPVTGFGYKMPVSADTTAMSTPHEIEYTLFFDPETIE